MLGDDAEDMLAKGGVRWLQKRGMNVLTMSPAKKDYSHHNYPLERFEKAIALLKESPVFTSDLCSWFIFSESGIAKADWM